MIKKIFSIVLSISLILSGVSVFAETAWETTGNNLIYNPEFNTGVGDWYQQINGMFVHDATVGHNALGAGLVCNRTNVTQQVYQYVTLEEGETYLVSAWVKLKDAKHEGAKVQFLTSNSTTVTDYGSFIETSASEWRELKKTIIVDNAQKSVQVGFANYSSTEVEFYIDDVSVKKVDTSRLYPATLLLNGETVTNVPQNGVNQINFRCGSLNQHGGNEGMNVIKNGLQWSLVSSYEGVTINNDGVLTVEPIAAPGTVTVCVEYTSVLGGTVSATKDVTLNAPLSEIDNGNLIGNGDFEKVGFADWAGNFKILSEKAYDGKFSASVGGNKFGQYVYLKPGRKYFVTAMVNSNGSEKQFAFTTDNEDVAVSGNTINTENNDWQRLFAVLDTDALNSATKVLVSAQSSSSNFYADSFFLAEMEDEYKECGVKTQYLYGSQEKESLVNGDLTVKVNLNNGVGDKNLIIAAALYKDATSNKLEDVSFVNDVSLSEFETKSVALTKTLNITDADNQLVKVFVWKNNYTPQTDSIEFTGSDEIVMHVIPNGQGDSANNIFTTIGGATDKITQIKNAGLPYPKDGITIIIHEGEFQSKGIYLLGDVYKDNNVVEPADNWLGNGWRKVGTKPVTIKAADGESVSILGDKYIDGADFGPASNEEKARLVDANAREHLVKINLYDQGITNLGEVLLNGTYQLSPFKKGSTDNAYMPELIIDGKVMQLSRYPNKGHVLVDNIVYSGSDYENWTDEQKNDPSEDILNDGFIIAPNDQRFKNWANAKDAIMYGYWNYSWADQAVPIKSIDVEAGTITSKYPSTYKLSKGGYFYAYNLLEEIDSPGEYFIDRDTGILYLYPPENVDLSEVKVSLTQYSSPLLWLRSTHDIVFEGITFGNTRGMVVYLEGGVSGVENIVFKDCTFANTGDRVCKSTGIMYGNGFLNCDFKDVNGGVTLYGGLLRNLTPGNCFVENCTFDNFSRLNETYNSAIGFAGVGNIARNNTIKNGPHSAISFSGNNHIIEYNDISNVLTESGDMAAIYTGRSWISRGNKVRYNYIHDIASNIGNSSVYGANRVGVYGVYFDDLYCGAEVSGNIFANIDGYAILINGGRDNIFKNNTVVNTYGSIYMTSIGLEKGEDASPDLGQAMSGFHAELYKVRTSYDSEIWYNRYPQLLSILDNEPLKPVDNIFSENLFVNSGYRNIDNESKKVIIEKNNIVYSQDEAASAGFYDYENKNYTLRTDSPAYNIKGFHQVSLDKVGVLED